MIIIDRTLLVCYLCLCTDSDDHDDDDAADDDYDDDHDDDDHDDDSATVETISHQ